MLTLEVAANSVESALAAQRGGANRVELCANLSAGGTTPSIGTAKIARQLLDIDIFILIRPRGGNFVYSQSEVEVMEADIRAYAGLCDGVVFGALDSEGRVEREQNGRLLEVAREYGLKCTFHRAIDRSHNLFESMERVIELGFDRILTSGGYPSVVEGAGVVGEMIKRAGDRIIVMPGAGISEHNISALIEQTGLREYHGSFSTSRRANSYVNATIADPLSEQEITMTSEERVRKAVENAKKTIKLTIP